MFSPAPVGTISYRPGATMASQDGLRITVTGRQTHGAVPWGGVDPIVVSAQIVLGLQTIISRQIDITAAPAIISIGSIHGGVRRNIISDEVKMVGTIRTFDPQLRHDIQERIRTTAEMIALSAGAQAEVFIDPGVGVTFNDPDLTQRMLPILQQVVGHDQVVLEPPRTTAEDFSYYQQEIPGFFFFLGVSPRDVNPREVAQNHSPHFLVDESALIIGVRSLAGLAVGYLEGAGPK